MNTRPNTLVAWLLLTALVAGCAGRGEAGPDGSPAGSERDLFERGIAALEAGNLVQARTVFEQLQRFFPFGDFSEQVAANLVYVNYRVGRFADAQAEAEKFLRTYPGHPLSDYAAFMQSYLLYTRDIAISFRLLRLDPSVRQIGAAEESMVALNEFVLRHPTSPFVVLARFRIVALRNIISMAYVRAGYWYEKRKAWVAAYERGAGVLQELPGSFAEPWALAMMVRTAREAGLDEEADRALQVLTTNFPDVSPGDRLPKWRKLRKQFLALAEVPEIPAPGDGTQAPSVP